MARSNIYILLNFYLNIKHLAYFRIVSTPFKLFVWQNNAVILARLILKLYFFSFISATEQHAY